MFKSTVLSLYSTLTILMLIIFSLTVQAQADSNAVRIQDCCMMKDGRMMHVTGGKMEVLEREMVMKNGTRCNANGECITLEGEKTMMKEGECMDMMGRITDCNNLKKPDVNEKKKETILYTCPKHVEIEEEEPGICPKCGSTLVERK